MRKILLYLIPYTMFFLFNTTPYAQTLSQNSKEMDPAAFDTIIRDELPYIGLDDLETMLEEGYKYVTKKKPSNGVGLNPAKNPWCQTLWSQIHYRLLAYNHNMYSETLDYASDVIFPDYALNSLDEVKFSFTRLFKLIRMADNYGLSRFIDPLADSIVPNYKVKVANFRTELRGKEDFIIAKIESDNIESIIDTDSLAHDSLLTEELDHHMKRVTGNSAIFAACLALREYKQQDVDRYLEVAYNACDRASSEFLMNSAKTDFIKFETSLRAVHDNLDRIDLNPYSNHEDGDLEIYEEVLKTYREFRNPANLRALQCTAEKIREIEAETENKEFAKPVSDLDEYGIYGDGDR